MHQVCISEFASLISAPFSDVAASVSEPLEREAVLGTGYALVATRHCDLTRTRERVRRCAIGEAVDPSPLSELQAAARLLDLGAECPEEVPEDANERTPDFLVRWASGATTEVEVTRKRRHREAEIADAHALEIVQTLVAAREGKLFVPLSVYVTSFDADVREEVVEAAERLGAQHPHVEAPHRWSIAIGTEPEPPSWWKGEVPLKHMHSASAAIRLGYPSPARAYLRAIARKAKGHQESGEHPFVIAHDCHELTNGVFALRRPVIEAMGGDDWQHVDGVLLFRLTIDHDGLIGWIWDIIPNPNAHQLPPELFEQRPPEATWLRPIGQYHFSHQRRIRLDP